MQKQVTNGDAARRSQPEASAKAQAMVRRYARRQSPWYQRLRPPLPALANPREPGLPYTEGMKLFVGGAGRKIRPGFLNLDLVYVAGVDVVADVEALPFRDESIAAVECDAVLEHVRRPEKAAAEFARVLRPGGHLHVVVPFCHPFHEYPRDFRRWTVDGLCELLCAFEVIDCGLRTGPTATLLAFVLEYVKLLTPRPLRRVTYGVSGWLLWPLRYLDAWLMSKPEAKILGNHVYALVRKPASTEK